MKISFNHNIYFNRFDKYRAKTYNSFGMKKHNSNIDRFEKNKEKLRVELPFDTRKEIELLKQAEKLNMSPVSYLVQIIDDYLSDKKDSNQFVREILTETRKMQFAFSHMPQNEILSNQRIFIQEFKFADEIISSARENSDSKKLKKAIQQSVLNYNNDN